MRLAPHATVCLVAVAILGCQSNTSIVDPQQLADARQKYLLTTEPEGVEGVIDVQETFEQPRDVVIVGQIGGVDNPWTAGQAAFVMADPVTLLEDAGEDHVCDDPGCKFCARKKVEKLKEGLAIVTFQDGEGKVVPIDARRLFDVAEKQMVVVRGRASVDELGCLVVAANGLYVRQ